MNTSSTTPYRPFSLYLLPIAPAVFETSLSLTNVYFGYLHNTVVHCVGDMHLCVYTIIVLFGIYTDIIVDMQNGIYYIAGLLLDSLDSCFCQGVLVIRGQVHLSFFVFPKYCFPPVIPLLHLHNIRHCFGYWSYVVHLTLLLCKSS